MNQKAVEAANAIKDKIHIQTKIAIVLGSGLGNLVDAMTDVVSLEYANIPHFPLSSVQGHKGEIFYGKLSEVPLLAFSGRVHFYEGYALKEVVFSVSVMAELGISDVILTNASGAINETFCPGDIVIIKDHINLLGDNPLVGAPQFTDMTDAYHKELRNLANNTAAELKIQVQEGVYLALSGPTYETPAEIRTLRILGADLVGMSTVPEVIMANTLGMRVLGLSMATNMAAGITGQPLSHEEVIETSNKAAEKFKRLVSGIIEKMGSNAGLLK